ncbi:MAG: GGDEF domain-containing protein [Deltaproteobacteria bacterium]|nr:GGDEF domain-containing protein [Deltaproteobacteria bacterium]
MGETEQPKSAVTATEERSERRVLATLLMTGGLGVVAAMALLYTFKVGGPGLWTLLGVVSVLLVLVSFATARGSLENRSAFRGLAVALATGLLLIQASTLLAQPAPSGVVDALFFVPALAPFVYVLAFHAWEAEIALVTSGLFLAASTVLPVVLIALGVMPPLDAQPLLVFFLGYSLTHSLLIGLILLFARHRRQVTAARATIDELGLLVRTDALTGALNRRGLVEQLWIEAERSTDRDCRLALIFVDLDHFKRVNDRWGHPAGDRVLAAFADLLTKLVRTSDVVGRWGGEEFVVLMRRPTTGEALFMADRLRRSVEDQVFPVVGSLTASFGVAELGPGETVSEVIDAADEALYRAKAGGRNRTCASRAMMSEMEASTKRHIGGAG